MNRDDEEDEVAAEGDEDTVDGERVSTEEDKVCEVKEGEGMMTEKEDRGLSVRREAVGEFACSFVSERLNIGGREEERGGELDDECKGDTV